MNQETLVQQAIIDLWRLKFRWNKEVLLAIPNGVHLSEVQAKIAVSMGLHRGASDLLLVREGGRVLWIEVKRPELRVRGRVVQRGGSTEASQISFRQTIESLGHEYVVVDSTDAFLVALEERGVKPVVVSSTTRRT